MRRQDTYVGVIRSTVIVVAVGFAWSSFALAEKPTSPPAPSQTVQEEKATPADSDEVQERTVSLTQAVHFTDAKGADHVVGPGKFRVEAAGKSDLKLTPADGKEPIVLEGQAGSVMVPMALSVPVNEDAYHLVLLLPKGKIIDVVGSPSGVKSRGSYDYLAYKFSKNKVKR